MEESESYLPLTEKKKKNMKCNEWKARHEKGLCSVTACKTVGRDLFRNRERMKKRSGEDGWHESRNPAV